MAVLLGVAGGWLLRGRRDGGPGRSIVDGDPVAGLADIATPTPPATTDLARPAATVDPAPTAVADEPTPVDTISAPAAVTASEDPAPVHTPAEAPSTVDPADMALTEAPPPVPTADRSDAGAPTGEADPEPVAVEEQPAPSTVVAPRPPADDLASTGTPPVDTTPLDTTPADTTPVDTTPLDTTPADTTPADTTPADTTPFDAERDAEAPAVVRGAEAPAVVRDAEPRAVGTDESVPAAVTPVGPTPAPTAGETTDADAEPVRATPPVRPAATATPPVRPLSETVPSGAEADPSGPADDFRRIQGVGPKMAAALQAAGVRTYGQLGELDEPALRDLIRAAGLRAAPGLATWPQQARVLAGAGDEVVAVLPDGSRG
ncbi:hypothetical protein ABZS77_21315 [Micromonospora sp. NPDC005298]|uniref:hypothetical protein n=1 Tax=Micromonospora sp. NPDC005298 TaxID=3156873 RepID=UPI0033A2D65E